MFTVSYIPNDCLCSRFTKCFLKVDMQKVVRIQYDISSFYLLDLVQKVSVTSLAHT